jgi:hypothetical protein
MKSFFVNKKNLIYIIIIGLISLCFNSYIKWGKRNIPLNTHEQGTQFNLEEMKSYTLTKCSWYEKNNILLTCESPGENIKSKIIIYNSEKEESYTIYEGFFSIENTDSILINETSIGYETDIKALIFDRGNKKPIKEFIKPNDTQIMRFSPNMEYAGQIKNNELFITNNNSLECSVVRDISINCSSLLWSNDNSKLAIITNDYSDVCVINKNNLKKEKIIGGKDFKYPDKLVDLRNTEFLDLNNYLLIDCLCEYNDAFIV